MPIIKKLPAIFAFAFAAAVAGTAAQADEKPQAPRQYRVIFNCDGHAVCKDAGGDLNQWIENLFGPLEKSHVEALFWCDGAGGNTANYKSDVLEATGKRSGKPRPWIKRLLDEGHDPPKIVVREAKKRDLDVFYSFRINDIHDSFTPDEKATFKVAHPEWMIGARKYGDVTGFPTSLNFAVPEVRELKFRVIEELFQKYDFDGLEIDFLRSAPYFLPGEEAKHAHLLTELLRRVRNHLNERGQCFIRHRWRDFDEQYTNGDGYLNKLCMELVGLDSSRCRPPTRDVRDKFREKAHKMLLQCKTPKVVESP